MTYSVLYNDDINMDMITLLTHINGFTKGLGVFEVAINPDVCRSVLLGMRQDFPHKDGRANASVFKQLANFVTFFVASRPILNPFPEEVIGPKLAEIVNHQNGMVAFQIAVDSLQGAAIHRNGDILILKERIQLSKHSYIDIIDAVTAATPSTHFKMITVLLEQLTYKSNPDCQYTIVGP